MLKTKHLIAGEWLDGSTTFENQPIHGTPETFQAGNPELVEQACAAAEAAFDSYSATSGAQRAAFLRRIGQEIEARGPEITEIGMRETGLPEARLNGERGRTVAQLNLFADHVEAGKHLDLRHDKALPERQPLPRPELRMMQRPIGPVAVFGASNFPLAFSSAGGDTAAALAAGCPVVVKGHSAHPSVADIVAQAVDAARAAEGLHPGVFSQIQGGNRAVGEALVRHPLIRAVGFTGSLAGGRALFDLCAQRPDPIPFFGELGSINPVFVLPRALAARGGEIATGWAASLLMGAGQFCTNPGVVVLPAGDRAESFVDAAQAALNEAPDQPMLTPGIAGAYRAAREALAANGRAETRLARESDARHAAPALFVTRASDWLADISLHEEAFGPLGVVVLAQNVDEMRAVAQGLEGQLTATLQIEEGDAADAAPLLRLLERKAGRVLANGFPTGVEVCDAMVHGGPYPASTNFGATSVGTLSIRRFLRPVCFQNIPETLLPAEMRGGALS